MDRLLWMAHLRSLALATEVTQEIFAMFKYACISWLVNSILKMHCSCWNADAARSVSSSWCSGLSL